MKKLLQINSVINTGSTGRIAEGIGITAMDSGWESYIAYGRSDNKSQSNTIKIGSKWNVYIHGLKTRLTDRHGLGSKRATKTFVEKIKQINPDIIHLHNIHGYYLNYEILFSYLESVNIPVLWTLHDCWPYTGHCIYYDYAKCDKWKTEKGCHHCPETRSYPRSFIDHSPDNFRRKKQTFTELKNLVLVPVSKWLKSELQQSFLKDAACTQIYNGVDLDIFKSIPNTEKVRQKYSIPDCKKIFLGVAGIWDRRKGVNDFVKLQDYLNPDEALVLVGLSNKQIKDLPKGIIGIKRTENQNDLAGLYSMASALVNLTLEDNFPTVNIEALACGTPVITYNTGGSPEAINRTTGWVVPKGDLKGVRKALDECSKVDPSKIKRDCRQRAENNFDRRSQFQEYISLYNKIV